MISYPTVFYSPCIISMIDPMEPPIVIPTPTKNNAQQQIYKVLDISFASLYLIIMYPGSTNPNVPVQDHPIKLMNEPKSLATIATSTVIVTKMIRIK